MDSKASRKRNRNRPAKNRPKNSAQEQANPLLEENLLPETNPLPEMNPATEIKPSEELREDVVVNLEPVAQSTTVTVESQPNDDQQVVDDTINMHVQETSVQPIAISTGNEELKKDVFVQIEPSSETTIVVEPQRVNAADDAIQANEVESQPESSILNESDDLSMPDILTKLNTANGAEVYLLGTAHFSPNSVKDVQKVMRAIKPNIVVLELCRERAFMLTLNEADLLEQNRNLTFEKVRTAIAQKGLAQGLIYIMFIKMSASLTEKLGLAPGSEFRAGANEAHQIPGCSIALGDRSLRVTLARAVASVSAWQKIKLIYQVLMNDAGMTQEEVEKCKEKDILEQLMQELGVEFPGFKRVILDERNIYLAHSIYNCAQNYETSTGPQKVVAIVGIGHVAGIVEHWGKTKDEDIAKLNEIPETSKTRRFVTKTIKCCSIALLVYVGYRILIPSSIQNSVIEKLSGLTK